MLSKALASKSAKRETGEAEAHGRKTAEGFLVCIDSITSDPISGELRASLLRWQVLDICLCDTGIPTEGGWFMANAKASPNLEALPRSPSLAQTLPSDAVLDALKMILLGAPLNEVLTTITRLIEAHSTGMLCSIFLLDEDSLHLRYGVAASLPEAYRAATDGICIGPNVGSCGTAAYLRQPVFVSDIASDPRWVKFRDFALQSGLRAAWSTPIMSHDGKVLGTFGMYYSEVRQPGPGEIQLIDYASRIAGIAIERNRSQTALTRAFEQIEKSEAELRHIVDAIPQMIAVLNPDGTVLYMNQTMLDYTGLTIEEVMAKDVRHRAGRYSGLGLPLNWIVADIVRMKDGILVEHWDVIQDEATRESSKSGLPMFGEKFGG